MTSGNRDPQTVTAEPDLWSRQDNIRRRRAEARVTAEQNWINSRMTPGEPLLPLQRELMTTILWLICLTAVTTVHTAAAFYAVI